MVGQTVVGVLSRVRFSRSTISKNPQERINCVALTICSVKRIVLEHRSASLTYNANTGTTDMKLYPRNPERAFCFKYTDYYTQTRLVFHHHFKRKTNIYIYRSNALNYRIRLWILGYNSGFTLKFYKDDALLHFFQKKLFRLVTIFRFIFMSIYLKTYQFFV